MKVYEIKLKVYLLENVELSSAQSVINKFIDVALSKKSDMLEFHNKNVYKNYCFNSFYPLEEDRMYKADNIYSIIIRTIDKNLAIYFNDILPNIYTKELKGLKSEYKIITNKAIKSIYSITPVVIKNEEGYWKNIISRNEFERRVKDNLIKKYNRFTNEKIDEEFVLYSLVEYKNNKPIAIQYKNIVLLGDKISLEIEQNKEAQLLAYMALGTGLGEMNSRGLGFVGYRWI